MKKSLDTRAFAHRLVNGVFIPLLGQPSEDIDDESNAAGDKERAHINRVEGVSMQTLVEFDEALWSPWDAIVRQPRFKARNALGRFKLFIEEESTLPF